MLITAHNSYYPIDRVPEFWGWLAHVCSQEHAKIPIELYEEITDGNDALTSGLGKSRRHSKRTLARRDSRWRISFDRKAMPPTLLTRSLRRSAGTHS